MNGRPRLLLVSPRPPRRDGQGDQRRAHAALTALREDWEVEVFSWLPDAEQSLARQWRGHPSCLLRAVALTGVRPVQVAYVQALVPHSRTRWLPPSDVVLYMTDRAVPRSPACPYVIDFIDDLGGAALQRASMSGPLLGAFWRWEGRRIRRLDGRLAAGAALSLTVSESDAAAIAPTVQTIHHAMATKPTPAQGNKIVFTGNLFYRPNLEAALWICEQLTPRLKALNIDPQRVVIAGRRPPASILKMARTAGIDLRPDVVDLTDVIAEAAVVICPVAFGSGVQSKVLDAVGAGRPCVLTPFSNQALGLDDGRSALVRDRTPEAFGQAVVALLDDPVERNRLAANARHQLESYTDKAVADVWRRSLSCIRDTVMREA